MPEWSSLVIFILAALALLITPGPAVLYIIARSIDQGRLAGVVSALGIAVGALFHIAAAAFGISALLMASALAFKVIKYLGAAYLIYLGIRKLTEKDSANQADTIQHQKLSRIFTQGVVVNLLNPKTALFFFAFLPQFVDPARGSIVLQVLFLGLIFVTMAICSDSTYALLAGTAGHWLKGNLAFSRGQRYFSGSIYLALGITAALSGSNSK